MIFATCYIRLFSGSFKNRSKARLINSEIFMSDFSDSSFSRASCEAVMYMFILFISIHYTVFNCMSRKKIMFFRLPVGLWHLIRTIALHFRSQVLRMLQYTQKSKALRHWVSSFKNGRTKGKTARQPRSNG